MKVKTQDTMIISGKKVEFKAQCSTYTMQRNTFEFFKTVEENELRFGMDYSDNAPCIYDTEARKITAGAQGQKIAATLDYCCYSNQETIKFSLFLHHNTMSSSNEDMSPSNEDYITFTQDLACNEVRVCFKSTTGETKLHDVQGLLHDINFQLNHEYQISFSKENDSFTIRDDTTNRQLYPPIKEDEICLSGSSATIFDEQ